MYNSNRSLMSPSKGVSRESGVGQSFSVQELIWGVCNGESKEDKGKNQKREKHRYKLQFSGRLKLKDNIQEVRRIW